MAYSHRPAGSRPRGSQAPPLRCSGHTSSCPGPGHTARGQGLRPLPYRARCCLGRLSWRGCRSGAIHRGLDLNTNTSQMESLPTEPRDPTTPIGSTHRHLRAGPSWVWAASRWGADLGQGKGWASLHCAPHGARTHTHTHTHAHSLPSRSLESAGRFNQ